jgi:predicted esterase
MRAADMPQMAAAFAPRPQFFLTVSGDWTARFHEHGFPAVAAVYEVFGARDRVSWQRWDKGHAYDQEMREAAYDFFPDALRLEGGAKFREPDGGVATENRQTLAALDVPGVPRDLAPVRAEFLARLGAPRGRPAAEVRRSLRGLFARGADQDAPATAAAAPRRVDADGGEGAAPERWTVPTDGDLLLPVLVRRAQGDAAGDGARVAILLGDRGKADVLARHGAFVDDLLERGVQVMVADVRYVGELDLGRAWRDLYGRFFGLDEGVLAVRDVHRLIAALPALGLPDAAVAVVGFGSRGAVAVFAAVLAADGDAGRVVAGAPALGPPYRDASRAPALSRVLLHGDLDDACAILGSRALVDGACTAEAVAAALAR